MWLGKDGGLLTLGEIEVDALFEALRAERSAWIQLQDQEDRKLTQAEITTICILGALESVLKRAAERHLG